MFADAAGVPGTIPAAAQAVESTILPHRAAPGWGVAVRGVTCAIALASLLNRDLLPPMTHPPDGAPRPVTSPDVAANLLREGMVHQKAGALDEAMRIYRRVAASPDSAIASAGWRHVAGVHRLHSEWDAALDAARRAARIAEEVGVRELYAEALNAEAIIHQMREDFAQAIPLLEQMLEITADPKGQGIALQNLGSIAAQQGDFARARRYFLRSHACFERAGYTHGVAIVLNNFGRAALDHANARVAITMLEDALGAARRVGDADLEALVHRNIAEAAVALDDREQARTHLEAAERSFTAAGNRARLVECLRLRAELAERELGADAARARYREAYALATEVGALGEQARLAERLAALGEPTP